MEFRNRSQNVQNRQGSPLRYGLDDWPPLSQTVLFGLQWAAIVIPSIIVLGHVVASLQFTEFADRTPYLQKLFIVTAVTLVIQVLWGHRLPLIVGPATVLLIGVIASQGFPVGDIYTAILIGGYSRRPGSHGPLCPGPQSLYRPSDCRRPSVDRIYARPDNSQALDRSGERCPTISESGIRPLAADGNVCPVPLVAGYLEGHACCLDDGIRQLALLSNLPWSEPHEFSGSGVDVIWISGEASDFGRR